MRNALVQSEVNARRATKKALLITNESDLDVFMRVFHAHRFVNIGHGFTFTLSKPIPGKLGFCKHLMNLDINCNHLSMSYVLMETSEFESSVVLK